VAIVIRGHWHVERILTSDDQTLDITIDLPVLYITGDSMIYGFSGT
jgi:hypothetical protein